MMRLVFLSCLVFGLALGEDDPAVTSSPPPASAPVPTPDKTLALATKAASDNRYFVYKTKLNWFQASELCLQFGQRLATFNSEADYTELAALLDSPDLTANYWVAASDLGERDKYVWSSTGLPMTYTKWAPGEPNHAVRDCEVEHCVEIRSSYHYKMNDHFCSELKYFACERV